jgi:hypothetical protein
MKNKIKKILTKIKKQHPELKHIKFTIKEKETKNPLKIIPTLKAYFQKKHKRNYKIIIPKNKKNFVNKSEKEIEKWIKNELSFVLESQALPPIQLAGFTLQYLFNKKEHSTKQLFQNPK